MTTQTQTAKRYGIFNVDTGEMVEGGFFSRDAAYESCDTWNAEEYTDRACTQERYPDQRRFYAVRVQS